MSSEFESLSSTPRNNTRQRFCRLLFLIREVWLTDDCLTTCMQSWEEDVVDRGDTGNSHFYNLSLSEYYFCVSTTKASQNL